MVSALVPASRSLPRVLAVMECYLEVEDEISLVMMLYHSNSNPKTVTVFVLPE